LASALLESARPPTAQARQLPVSLAMLQRRFRLVMSMAGVGR